MQTKPKKDCQKLVSMIIMQNVFCINRTHCFEKRMYKILGNIIFSVSLITITGINILEIFTTIKGHTKVKDLSSFKLFAYIFQCINVVELIYLAIAAKQRDNVYKKLKLLEEECEIIPYIIRSELTVKYFTENNSKKTIILSLISVVIDVIGLNVLDYPTNVVITLTIAFAAHDTELMFYSLIIEDLNDKLNALMDVSAEVGTKIYRHILVAAAHFSKEFKLTICLTVIMTLTTTIIYIGSTIIVEGPRSRKVLPYFMWREIRSLFSLWLLCSASFQTRILCSSLVKRLSERLVFGLDSKDKSCRKLTKRWLKCVRSLPVQYVGSSCYTLSPTLPLTLLDYTTNYLLIIVQMYPILISKNKKSQVLESI